jgi:hypothetical protein
MNGPQIFLMLFGALLALIGVAVFFSLTWFKRGGEGSSAFKVVDKLELHVPHALVIFVAGVALIALPFVLPVFSGAAAPIAPASQPLASPTAAGAANRPPVVGDITLDSATVLAGQTVRAQVAASDPDRDRLDIRWLSDVGSFLDRESGASVIYQAPAAGGSFQLTATVTDGANPAVSVSRSFILGAIATPTPASLPPVPTAAPAPTATPTPPPTLAGLDLSGRWNYETGYVVLQAAGQDQYTFNDFNSQDQLVGQGFAARTGGVLTLSGTVLAFGLGYEGQMEIVSPALMRGFLVDQLGNSAFLVLTR